MSRKGRDGSSGGVGDDDEVETLLRAAEDELLLNLSIDSHVTRGRSQSYLDADLHRRLQALRSRKPPPRQHPTDTVSRSVDDGDIFARFAALKEKKGSSSDGSLGIINGKSDDDEVAKVMRWAVDAARLDPDDDDEDDVEVSSSSTTDDDYDDDYEEDQKKRGKQPKNNKGNAK